MGVSLRLLLTSKKTSESSSSGSITEPLSLAENLLQQLQLHNESEEVNKAAQYIVDELSKVGETTAEQVLEDDTIGQGKGKEKEKKMPEKKKRALPGKFAKEEEGKPSWAAKKGKLPFGAKKGKGKVAAVASEVVEEVSQDVPVVEQPPVEAEVAEKPQEKKKKDIVKKNKALAGKFADEEEHEFKAKKGKKDKKHGKDHAAVETGKTATAEPTLEEVSVPAEVAAEPAAVAEATEETQDKKKRDIVKKEKALAGKFADEEEHTFKSKKGKKLKESSAAPAAKEEPVEQEPVAVQEPAVPAAAGEIPAEPAVTELEATEKSEEKKKKDIIKKKKALAGKFVGEQEKKPTFSKKDKHKTPKPPAEQPVEEPMEEPAAEPAGPEVSEQQEEKKKKDIIKKKKALAGKFVGEQENKPSFSKKDKHKTPKPPAEQP